MSETLAFEDSIGAQLLTAVLTLPPIIKERHDTLEFVNHTYIRHNVRLVVDVAGLSSSRDGRVRRSSPYSAWGAGALQVRLGRVAVPLGDLDRHSRATTHVTDEAGEMMPLFTAGELDKLLGDGLVSFAARILEKPSESLVEYLRELPARTGQSLVSAGVESQAAADRAFETACEKLIDKFGQEALELIEELPFRLALVAITSAVQLVVEVDPQRGHTRALSYSYFRPISGTASAERVKSAPIARRLWQRVVRYWYLAGSTRLKIDLGPIGGCDRYQLSAESPFDTRFASARMVRTDIASHSPRNRDQIDVSQKFRISYTRSSSRVPWSGALHVRLMVIYTGVARASVYASVFLFACALAGTVRVATQHDHQLISTETDAAASLLLLFPGIAASAVAGLAPNTLTATLQFPMRVTLWVMSVTSFVLAVAAAFHLGGLLNLILWELATGFMLLAMVALVRRSREWQDE